MQEGKLGEMKDQVHMVQSHYLTLTEVMKRDQVEKERLEEENRQITNKNRLIQAEIERTRVRNTELEEVMLKTSNELELLSSKAVEKSELDKLLFLNQELKSLYDQA